jgi:hypothetical protein
MHHYITEGILSFSVGALIFAVSTLRRDLARLATHIRCYTTATEAVLLTHQNRLTVLEIADIAAVPRDDNYDS